MALTKSFKHYKHNVPKVPWNNFFFYKFFIDLEFDNYGFVEMAIFLDNPSCLCRRSHTNNPLNTDGSRIGNARRVSLGMWREPKFVASPFIWVPQQTVLCNCKRFFKGTFSFLLFNCLFWGVNCDFLVSRDFNKLMYLPFGEKKKLLCLFPKLYFSIYY